MSDLISRSKLINDIATYFFSDKCNLDRLGGDLREIIDNQPTAYSVDKVVEEFEKASKDVSRGYLGKDNNKYHKHYKAVRLSIAIEIVKQGGVIKDVE